MIGSSASGPAGTSQIATCTQRAAVRVAGRVAELTRSLPTEDPWLRIALADATGTVEATWLGRRSIPGVATGTRLVLDGRLAEGPSGLPTLLNPAYTLLAADRS